MFGKIIDTSHTRTTTEAVWFYIASLILLVGISTVLVHVLSMVGIVSGVGSFFDGGNIYTLIGTGFVLLLSTMMLTSKKLTSDLLSILLVGVGVYLAFTSSVLLGMIPVALLSTISSNK
jgi:hypothetical protein